MGVLAGRDALLPKRLLDAVGNIFHVDFVAIEENNSAELDAALLFGVPRDKAEEFAQGGVRSMAFLSETPGTAPAGNKIQFGTTSHLAECFRGKRLADKSLTQFAPIVAQAGDDIMASRGGEPFWLRRNGSLGVLDLVAAQPIELTEGDYLYKHLDQDDWARLLPLLHFLREVSGWKPPPIRACFMFDDPNLHWSSYGYIRYPELAQHARDHNYHAAFAMIPMDCWYAHGRTAKLFRENPDRLSLLFHGNNHTYYELTQAATTAARQALAAQAIQRIERLERVSGIKVPRAMTAPHGACSVAMSDVLLRSGFEIACISRSSLMIRNPEVTWSASVGMNPAEFPGEGLPVIPRFNIRWDSSCALFAAFLGQPIILVGHHDDLAGGLDLLAHWAEFINGFGPTQWCDAGAMSRSNFCTRTSGDVLEVEMFARKIELEVPDSCTQLRILRPWLSESEQEALTVTRASVAEQFSVSSEDILSVSPGQNLRVTSNYPNMIDLTNVVTFLPDPWAIARRQLCEARDRLRPIVGRFNRAKRQSTNEAPFRQIV